MSKREKLQEEMINATKYSFGAEIFAKLVTPFTSMILARILAPEAFGIIATISIIISLSDLLTDAGFSKYLVQHEFKSHEEFAEYANIAFWANLGISCLVYIAIFIFSPFLAELVGAQGYELAIIASSAKLIITSFTSIQRAVYQRSLNYKTIFVVRVVVAFVPLTVTIPLALLGFDYWALIIATLVNEGLYALILTKNSVWKPRLYFNLAKLKNMVSFSIWSLIEQCTIWVSTYVDTFIISKYMSSYYLGLYKQPYQLITNIYSVVTASVFAILFSALSRFNDDNDEVGYRRTLISTQKMLSVLIVPMGFGIFLYREFVTKFLLGSQWTEASIVVGCFALEKIIQLIFNNSASEIYRSRGKPRISALAQSLFIGVLVPTCIVASTRSFREFVVIRAGMCLVFLLIHEFLVYKCFKINLLSLLPQITSIIISTGIMVSVGYILKKQMPASLLFNIFEIGVCACVYGASLLLFKDTREIVCVILKKIARKIGKVN